MATKEDILEQIVEEYLLHQGYFVRHNIKYLPDKNHPNFVSKDDSNHSDIDVVGVHPLKSGHDRIIAVSCKSWQVGFNPSSEIEAIEKNKIVSGRPAWKGFRELMGGKWSDAFVNAIKDVTGSDQFTCVLAVTKISGDRRVWEDYPRFRKALGGNALKVVTFGEMISEIEQQMTTTLAATEVGRLLQMFKAAGIKLH